MNMPMDAVAQATAAVQTETVKFRVVADEEIKLLKPLFDRLGWPLPDPNMAKVIVAEAGMGKDAIVLGFSVVQFVTCAEPIWVHPATRGSGVAEGLVENVVHYIEHDCKIKRWITHAKEGSFAARLAEKNAGCQLVQGLRVYLKNVP